MCTVVVVNYNDAETVAKYIHNIESYKCFEKIIIVDNCSTDNSFGILSKYSSDRIDIIQSEKNGGYGYGNNYGIKYAIEKYSSEYILISNPDVEFEEKTIIKLEESLKDNQDVGAVTAMMYSADYKQSELVAWKIPTFWQEVFETPANERIARAIVGTRNYDKQYFKSGKFVEVGCIPGSMLMVKSSAMKVCGFFDENIFLYGEETVLGIKLKKNNYKTFLVTDQYYIHRHSVSINKTIKSLKKQRILLWKSRMYILENYYDDMNLIKKICIYLYALYNIERVALSAYRHKKRG